MQQFIQFAVIGLGPAAIYSLAALGVVTIYRGSGVVNFAHGGFALVGASVFVKLRVDRGWPTPVAIAVGLVAASLTATIVGAIIVRFLANTAPVMQVIATLGFLSVIQEVNFLLLGGRIRTVSGFFPRGQWTVGGVRFGYDRLILLGIAAALTAAMALMFTRTWFGRRTSAAAEDRRAAASLGISPLRIALSNWALGGALAGLAGILIVPVSGFSAGTLILLVLPAFAAVLIGRFSSFGLAFAGAIALGVSQSLVVGYVDTAGASEAVPFVVIVVMLLASSKALPGRGFVAQRLPRVASGLPSWRSIAAVGLVTTAIVLLIDGGAEYAFVTMVIGTIAIGSHVVLLGYAGQVSLGQYTLAGVAAMVAGRLNEEFGIPFVLVALIGIAAAALAGFVFGVPALRSRGVTLAIVTLGLGIAVSSLVFTNPTFVGGLDGTKPRSATLFGLDISTQGRYALLVVAVAVVVAVVIRSVRGGRIGRRMLAIRSNERAAASVGISVGFVKLYAFVLAAAIAGVAGVLQAFRVNTIEYAQFDFNSSLSLLSAALVGGVGYLAGPVFGAPMLENGIIGHWLRGVDDLQIWLLLVGGSLLVLTLVLNPHGVAHAARIARRATPRRAGTRAPAARPGADALTPVADRGRRSLAGLGSRRPGLDLTVRNLTVAFGAVVAVDQMSIDVRSGQILGVLGANGAGKTTLIDSISGYTKAAPGSTVVLGGTDISRLRPHLRSRRGLGRSFQSLELFEDMPVRENLLVAVEPTSRSMWVRDLLPRRRAALSEDALRLAEALGLTGYLDCYPDELPHGARSLVGVARAVLSECPILLLDEPAAGLSDHETDELADVLVSLARDLNIGVLLVEHHVGLVSRVSDEIVVMDFGARICSGSPDEVLADSRVKQAYLGVEAA